jgi:hypothetical protein
MTRIDTSIVLPLYMGNELVLFPLYFTYIVYIGSVYLDISKSTLEGNFQSFMDKVR